MKTFKNLVEGLKKTKRIYQKATKVADRESESFHTFHDIMGSSDEDKLISAAQAHGNSPKRTSPSSQELFTKADTNVKKMMMRAVRNPEKGDLIARNIISAMYGKNNVPRYPNKLAKVKAAISGIKPGDRNIQVPSI